MAERELLVRIIGDDRDLQRALSGTERKLDNIDRRTASFGKGLKTAFAAAGLTLGAAAAFDVLGDAIADASALNEEIAKSNQIFGASAASIEDWSQSTARSIGVAQVEALKATGTFGNLFATVGLIPEQSAAMSTALVELAADLASFNNADPTDVLNAIRSGLIGEAEPLRRYGVLLSEARVAQEAMASSGKENVKELTNQEKALARYHIILSDTVLAQGDFARTADGAANQTKKLRAQLSDMSADVGAKFLPTMVRAVEITNSLLDIINQDPFRNLDTEKLEEIDVFALEAMRDRLAEIKGEGAGVVEILDEIIARSKAIQGIRPPTGPGGPGDLRATIDVREERDRQRDIAEAKREAERSAKQFNEFVQGMGLKLDKSGLTSSLNDDLAALRELERAILRRIKNEGRTFELVQQLTDTRLQIASIGRQQAADATAAAEEVAQAAEDAAQAGRDAFESTLDALDLKLEIAQTTRSFADDKKILRAIEQEILDRIKVEGRTTDLLRQLFNVRQQQEEVARKVREQQARARKEGQFKALGLTAEGDEPTPGSGSLLRRARSLQDQIKGTVLDTAKNRQILANVVRLLSTQFKKVGKDVRNAIDGMLDDIAGGFENAEKKVGGGTGEITKGGIRSTQRLLRGLDLTDEERKIIQQRNLGVSGRRGLSAFGVGLVPSTGTAGSIDRGLQQTETFIIQNLNVVSNDPNDMMKKLQKKARRSSGGRRGRHGGANLGMQ